MMPYAIGYSVFEEAIKANLPMASLINRAGNVVAASSQSVSYAVMEKGGNLNSLFNAVLADGLSTQAWPISGFTYFIVRKNSHVGDCSRRKAVMEYLYNFYHSTTVGEIASRLGFAQIPDFIRDIIIAKMINTVKCSNGEYALAAYRGMETIVSSAEGFVPILNTYLSSYNNIDSSVKWNLTYAGLSSAVWKTYIMDPDDQAAAFTMFSSKQAKLKYFTVTPGLTTNAFAHVAVIPIYHLNAFTSRASAPLQVTAAILAGIYTGSIKYWNDTAIQSANTANKQWLPFTRIRVVYRSDSCDTNSIFFRYLALSSPGFQSVYAVSADSDMVALNIASQVPGGFAQGVTSNNLADYSVTYGDSAIGFYLHTQAPNSQVANFCNDAVCSTTAVVPNNNGQSLAACTSDPSTVVKAGSVNSYDLQVSTSVGCYPIAATVDLTVFSGTSSSCPIASQASSAKPSSSTGGGVKGMVDTRVKLTSWLFSQDSVVKPLESLHSMAPTASYERHSAYTQMCDISCNGHELGYSYCGFTDCSWSAGDFVQVVSECNPKTVTRTVSYKLRNNTKCLIKSMPANVEIFCEYVPVTASLAGGSYFLCVFGIVVCLILLGFTVYHRNERIIRRSQPIFIYIFLSGAALLNLTIAAFLGPNTDAACMFRPWAFNLSATFMFGPLIMKLHRVDRLFNNPKMKKIKITDLMVSGQIMGLVVVDIIILILWSALETPRSIHVSVAYTSVYENVTDRICSTGLQQTFEKVILAWKAAMLAFGVMKV